jgi:thiamine biosynthesis lipoprotein ApbE
MLRKMLVIAVAAAMATFCLSGCKKSPSETKPEPNEAAVKTMAEYEAEAKKDITKENMNAELKKIEKEVEKEPNAKL